MSRLLWCVAAILIAVAAKADDPLWDRFQTPPAEARPIVRWWWNGNAVTQSEIVRQIDQLHRAGIGGMEICPIAMPPNAETSPQAKSLKWLGPEWCQMLKAASEAAAQRQMRVDLVASCGGPWGGEFVKPEHASQRVDLITRRLTGPQELKLTHEEFLQLPEDAEKQTAAKEQSPELLFLKLVPVDCKNVEGITDLLGSFDDQGQLTTKLPKGDFLLCAGRLRKGFATVQHCADGAGGPVLDHYSAEAVQAFLDRISMSVMSHLGQDLGRFVQTVACDDADLSGANWTSDFAAEFKRRCGYELGPYLPFVVDFDQRLPVDKEFEPTVQRVRHDYAKTLTELYQERFVETFHKWTRKHGTKSRMHMGNGPWLMGVADAMLVPDLPQVGVSIEAVNNQHEIPIASKYATSGGRISKRPTISARINASANTVFQSNLEQIKTATDLGFLLGANQTVLQGFNYSPREMRLPGWVQPGIYFSPSNPWWPYLPNWTDYHARLAALFQASEPVVRLAVLAPTADVWGQTGLSTRATQQTPSYLPQLSQALAQQGITADFVSQRTIQRAKGEQGKLCCGPMKYDAVVILEATSLAPATTSALVLFAKGGGKIAIVGPKPKRAVGLNNFEQRDRAVVQAMQHLTENKTSKIVEIAPPKKEEELLSWAGTLVAKLGLPRSVTFESPSKILQQVHYRQGDRDIYLLVNTSDKQAVSTTATFDAQGTHAWQWNPETGDRAVYPTQNRKAHIRLAPLASLLLVFEPTEPPSDAPRVAPAVEKWQELAAITGPWDAEFIPVAGQRFTMHDLAPEDLSKSSDERLKNFAGTAIYRTRFDLSNLPAGQVIVDLGKVHDLADVRLNDEPLGVAWNAPLHFNATQRLTAGGNMLEVRVATPLFNYTRSLQNNIAARYWLDKAANKEPLPAGLVGPVRLLSPVAMKESPHQKKESTDQANGR